jgi:CRP/FNR family transcriptional regulator
MINSDHSGVKCENCPAWSTCVLSALNGNDRRKTGRIVHQFRCGVDEVIFHQGEQALGAYILCQGRAKLLYRAQNGKKLLLRFCSPGDLLAGIASQEHAFSAISVDPSVVSIIDKIQATKLIRQNPELGLEIGRHFAREGERLLQRMTDLAYENVEERLAHVLLSLGKRHGVREGSALRIDIPFSQQDLADMVGASRQRVNRELRKLAEQGLIRVERCLITILDDKRLRNLK